MVSKLDIMVLREFATAHRGTLISKRIIKSSSKLLWQCNKGHTFQASWSSMKSRKHFCKVCMAKTNERKCRLILENHLNKTFKKIRIRHNPNDKRSFIEIDGFNSDLNLGFEYNGKHHYEYPNYYHKTKKEFQAQIVRDKRKLEYCVDHNIILIVIPYTEKNLELYITTELRKYNYGTIESK